MMDSRQIDRVIRRHVRAFDGVYSCDDLPQRNPRLLVANTDPSDEPGEHWIAISMDENGNGKYFDSFGRPPPTSFECYLDRHCTSWTHKATQYQSATSEVCRQYCVVWCVLNSRQVDLRGLLSGDDTGLNDCIVREIASKL